MAGVSQGQAGLQIQRDSLAQGQKQFERGMTEKIGSIALKYGLTLNTNDTLESVISRAQPRADAVATLELEDARIGIQLKRAQIALSNAQTLAAGEKLSTNDISELASAYWLNGQNPVGQAALAAAMKGGNFSDFTKAFTEVTKPRVVSDSLLHQKALMERAGNVDFPTYKDIIDNDKTITNKERAKEIARVVYGRSDVQTPFAMWANEFSKSLAVIGQGPGSQMNIFGGLGVGPLNFIK